MSYIINADPKDCSSNAMREIVQPIESIVVIIARIRPIMLITRPALRPDSFFALMPNMSPIILIIKPEHEKQNTNPTIPSTVDMAE